MPTPSDDTGLLDMLQRELALALAHGGRALFIDLSPGVDGHAHVRAFVRQAHRADRRLRSVVASAADPHVSAWRQIAMRLTARHRAIVALRHSAREWIGILPIVGPLLGAVVNTMAELRPRGPALSAALGTGSALDDVRRVLAHGRSEPRVIVLTHCEAADASELSGTSAFIQQLRDTRTLLLLTRLVDDARPAPGFTNLLWEAERLGVGRRISDGPPPVSTGGALVLTCGARIGMQFDAAQLMHASHLDEPELEHELALLVRARILAVRGTVERNGALIDTYEFRNPAAARYWRDQPVPDGPRTRPSPA